MQFVLNKCKKLFSKNIILVIIRGECKYISNLQIQSALAQANIPDSFKHFFEISIIKFSSLFKPIIIENIAFLNIFVKYACSKFSELRSLDRIYTIPNRNNHIQVIKLNFTIDLSFPFLANYSNFSSSLTIFQLSAFINFLDVISNSIFFY